MKQKDAGFSLVEILVSIVVLACIVIPICTSLVMCVRMDAKADAMLKAQLAVSSTVEQLMAKGISGEMDVTTEDGIVIEATKDGASPYYNVTVSYDDDLEDAENAHLITVTTTIRAAAEDADVNGGGGDE